MVNNPPLKPCKRCGYHEIKRRPCPCCGHKHSKVVLPFTSGRIRVVCNRCKLEGPDVGYLHDGPTELLEIKAVKLWNKNSKRKKIILKKGVGHCMFCNFKKCTLEAALRDRPGQDPWDSYILCQGCGASSRMVDNNTTQTPDEKVKTLWNTRALSAKESD